MLPSAMLFILRTKLWWPALWVRDTISESLQATCYRSSKAIRCCYDWEHIYIFSGSSAIPTMRAAAQPDDDQSRSSEAQPDATGGSGRGIPTIPVSFEPKRGGRCCRGHTCQNEVP